MSKYKTKFCPKSEFVYFEVLNVDNHEVVKAGHAFTLWGARLAAWNAKRVLEKIDKLNSKENES